MSLGRYSAERLFVLSTNYHRLLASATPLLAVLSNPLNVSLLTSQLLSTPSVWERPDGLRATVRILSIFNSAASHLAQQQVKPQDPSSLLTKSSLSLEEWATAVVKGADERSPRWRHLCALAGILLGFEGKGQRSLSPSFRHILGSATVKATNMALQDGATPCHLSGNSIAVVLSHVFDLLTDAEKLTLDHDLLSPILYRAPPFAREGLHSGYFLSTIDVDIIQVGGTKFDWPAKSSTYAQFQRMAMGPLIASLGALSRVTAFSLEHARDHDLLSTMMTEYSAFTRSLCVQWRQNKLSEIDPMEESLYLTDESLHKTVPLLWKVLKSTMFAFVVVLRSLIGRVLRDPQIPVKSGKSLPSGNLGEADGL